MRKASERASNPHTKRGILFWRDVRTPRLTIAAKGLTEPPAAKLSVNLQRPTHRKDGTLRSNHNAISSGCAEMSNELIPFPNSHANQIALVAVGSRENPLSNVAELQHALRFALVA